MFSPSNKIHREVGRAKDLSAPLYIGLIENLTSTMSAMIIPADQWNSILE